MRTPRRRFLQMAAGVATLAPLSRAAWALDYPTRPIHWIIGFPPGGGADIVARIMGGWLSERLGQQIIIENRPGAGTNIATQAVITSPPDGYTLLWAGISNVINATIYGTLPFDFLRDIAPVAGMVVYPLVFEVNPSVPAKNIPELIAYAKTNPGKIHNVTVLGSDAPVKWTQEADALHLQLPYGLPVANSYGAAIKIALS